MYSFSSVTELNEYADGVLSSDERLSSLSVTGEITNLTIYRSSGHAYFSLKDETSQINCVMFRNYLSNLNFTPENGMQVVLTGVATIYSPTGKYQIKGFAMARKGKGDLAEQMKLLFQKLSKEGLFLPEHKVRIPVLPERIGVITSPAGAVIHDIINTLNRRNPHYDLLIYPSAVQGEACAREVCEGIDYFSSNENVDVIIIARGGGSIEDLFGFNDETLARKIYDCDIPVISAVGHETDYTICDYVADLRAPTPTAAAELVIGRYDDLIGSIAALKSMLNLSLTNYVESRRRRLDALRDSKALYSPMVYIEKLRMELDHIKEQLIASGKAMTDEQRYRLRGIIESIEHLGPMNVLKRGYAYIESDGAALSSIDKITKGDSIDIVLADGRAEALITDIVRNEGDNK